MTATLAAEWRGPDLPDGTSPERLVFLHGFTQTRRSWERTVDALRDRYETVVVDAPGHGGSGELRLDLPAAADLLADVTGHATYVGYSMGGRLALHLAVARPAIVDRLVLVSSTAGISDGAARAARRVTDEVRAAAIERDGVDIFLERWLALPLFGRLPASAAQLHERRANSAAGLASSLRLAGTGAQESLWDRLHELTMPVLLVVGEHDEKFTAIARRMTEEIPTATLAVVPGAGHVVHLERADEFVDLLRTWLEQTPPQSHSGG